MAAWGRRVASSLSFFSLLAMAFFSFSGFGGVIMMFWGALVVLTQRLPDIPSVDEVTGVGGLRSNAYIGLLTLGEFVLSHFLIVWVEAIIVLTFHNVTLFSSFVDLGTISWRWQSHLTNELLEISNLNQFLCDAINFLFSLLLRLNI